VAGKHYPKRIMESPSVQDAVNEEATKLVQLTASIDQGNGDPTYFALQDGSGPYAALLEDHIPARIIHDTLYALCSLCTASSLHFYFRCRSARGGKAVH
jgi:hypothetical protein